MKTLNRWTLTIAAASTAILSTASAETAPPPSCEAVSLQMQAVALAAPRSGSLVNFTGSGGQLDPVPLLESSFKTVGSPERPTCVVLTFSAQIDPSDNYGVYQASIDGVPMIGHGTLAPEYGIATPIVFDAVNQGFYLRRDPYAIQNTANSRFVSYTFFALVPPGDHTMRIRVAGCCSSLPGGVGGVFVRAATAVLRW